MIFEFTESAAKDRRRLKSHTKTFDDAYVAFAEAAQAFRETNTPFPAKFRVKSVEGAKGVFEFTWSFSGPDGRATFEWDEALVDEKAKPPVRDTVLRLRRVGDHGIFNRP